MSSNLVRCTMIVLALLIGVGCETAAELVGPPTSDESPSGAEPPAPAPAGDPVHLGVCIDRSTSVPDDFAYDTLDGVAGALTSLVPPPEPPRGVGAAIAPARELTIRVRTIGSGSFAPEAEVLSLSVPAAPGIGEPPDPTADVSGYAAWRTAANDVVHAAAEERHAAASLGSAALRQLRGTLEPEWRSEIDGCVSAFVQSVAAGDRRLIVASDLDLFGQVDVTGDPTGTRMLVVHHCGATAETCEQRAAEFVQTWGSRGADVRITRPESAPAAIDDLMEGI